MMALIPGRYNGCKKNALLIESLFYNPIYHPFRISELIFEKRHKPQFLAFAGCSNIWLT